jgi:signal transduction histidine kinase
VLAHGGRIELLAGPGTRFRVTLPLGSPHLETA